MGKQLWEESYRHSQDDVEAYHRLATAMGLVLKFGDVYQKTMASSFMLLPMEQIMSFWSARWADQAFPIFQMGHKYAAALMATSVTVDAEDIRAPFKAFMIDVPSGVLSIEDPESKQLHDIRYVLAHHLKNGDGEMVWSFLALTTGRISVWQHGATIERMLEVPNDEDGRDWSSYSFGMEVDDRDQRVQFLLQRLILNTCLAVTTVGNSRPIGRTSNMSPGELRASAEPIVRVFQVGKPISLDCRMAVHDYLEGRRAGHRLSVQVLVGGHWKRQPYGPKSSLRKVIWREPYWRGPEDAPILVRPHKLGDNE